MSGLKKIKDRIGNVKSTRKITRAMQLVSASELKRSQNSLSKSKKYCENIEIILNSLLSSYSGENSLINGHKGDNDLIIALSSDKGLCGGLNVGVVKQVKKAISKKSNSYVFCIGKKVQEILSHANVEMVGNYNYLDKKADNVFLQATNIANNIIQLIDELKINKLVIVYNQFISAINQNIVSKTIIGDSQKNIEQEYEIEYEPKNNIIVERLAFDNLVAQIYHAILENKTSENGSRMVAMDNATKNSDEMIANLSLIYNRKRQSGITNQLIEIISGAESL